MLHAEVHARYKARRLGGTAPLLSRWLPGLPALLQRAPHTLRLPQKFTHPHPAALCSYAPVFGKNQFVASEHYDPVPLEAQVAAVGELMKEGKASGQQAPPGVPQACSGDG